MTASKNLLFICSKNKWRSPTAERLWWKKPGFVARSAGTTRGAKRHVSLLDMQWADVIFCMEEKHKSYLSATFRQDAKHVKIFVLDIPDDYQFMDPDLVEELVTSVDSYLLNT